MNYGSQFLLLVKDLKLVHTNIGVDLVFLDILHKDYFELSLGKYYITLE